MQSLYRIIYWVRKAKNYLFSSLRKIQIPGQTEKDLQLITQSHYFDEEWYLQHYSDVAQAKINPALHYLLYGGFEGRNPGNCFSSALYLKTHPDLVKTRINPLVHYLRYDQHIQSTNKTSLYLHVGLHKTGTSAIQRFLRANASLLCEKGFYYPVDGLGGDAHHGLASKLRRSAPLEDVADAEEWISNCERYCTAHNLSLLISSEVFSEPVRHDELAKIFQPFDINIIIYIRRQDHLIESVINQVLKDRQEVRSEILWMKLDAVYITDFTKRIGQWRETFPGCKLIVRRYGHYPENHSLEIDFLNSIGIQVDNLSYLKPGIVNESLNIYEFIVLRKLVLNGIISSRSAFEQAQLTLAVMMEKYKITDAKMVGNYFDYETRQRIMEMHADSNEQIRVEFFPNDEYLFAPVTNTPSAKNRYGRYSPNRSRHDARIIQRAT